MSRRLSSRLSSVQFPADWKVGGTPPACRAGFPAGSAQSSSLPTGKSAVLLRPVAPAFQPAQLSPVPCRLESRRYSSGLSRRLSSRLSSVQFPADWKVGGTPPACRAGFPAGSAQSSSLPTGKSAVLLRPVAPAFQPAQLSPVPCRLESRRYSSGLSRRLSSRLSSVQFHADWKVGGTPNEPCHQRRPRPKRAA